MLAALLPYFPMWMFWLSSPGNISMSPTASLRNNELLAVDSLKLPLGPVALGPDINAVAEQWRSVTVAHVFFVAPGGPYKKSTEPNADPNAKSARPSAPRVGVRRLAAAHLVHPAGRPVRSRGFLEDLL